MTWFLIFPAPCRQLHSACVHHPKKVLVKTKEDTLCIASSSSSPSSTSAAPPTKKEEMSHGRRLVLLLILLSLFSSSNEAATAAGGGGRGISSNPESEYDGGGGEWRSATATYFVRDATTASGRGGGGGRGACGFGDVEEMEPESDYGSRSSSSSAAAAGVSVSGAVFEKGSRCGGCFEVRCVDHILWCLNGSPSVVVTVTDFCPPNYGLPGDSGGWCNHPREHFQMSLSAFSRIAKTTTNVDVIPVQYRRVQCKRAGGMRFTVTGSSYFFQVLVANVASAGEVAAVKVKGSMTGWMPLARNWGQNWQCEVDLHGQPLSFEVTDGRGRTVTSYNVAPANWEYGQAFQGKQFQH